MLRKTKTMNQNIHSNQRLWYKYESNEFLSNTRKRRRCSVLELEAVEVLDHDAHYP